MDGELCYTPCCQIPLYAGSEKASDVTSVERVVFDTLGGDIQESSWSVMKKGGILVSIVSPPAEEKAKELGVRCAFVFIEPNASILEQLAKLVEQGELRPIIGAEFALQDIAKAHALSESGRTVGKIVLYVGQP